MTGTKLLGRLERLEQNQPSQTYNGAMRFIWDGPQDDAALAEAKAQAEAENKLVIVRAIVSPSVELRMRKLATTEIAVGVPRSTGIVDGHNRARLCHIGSAQWLLFQKRCNVVCRFGGPEVIALDISATVF